MGETAEGRENGGVHSHWRDFMNRVEFMIQILLLIIIIIIIIISEEREEEHHLVEKPLHAHFFLLTNPLMNWWWNPCSVLSMWAFTKTGVCFWAATHEFELLELTFDRGGTRPKDSKTSLVFGPYVALKCWPDVGHGPVPDQSTPPPPPPPFPSPHVSSLSFTLDDLFLTSHVWQLLTFSGSVPRSAPTSLHSPSPPLPPPLLPLHLPPRLSPSLPEVQWQQVDHRLSGSDCVTRDKTTAASLCGFLFPNVVQWNDVGRKRLFVYFFSHYDKIKKKDHAAPGTGSGISKTGGSNVSSLLFSKTPVLSRLHPDSQHVFVHDDVITPLLCHFLFQKPTEPFISVWFPLLAFT